MKVVIVGAGPAGVTAAAQLHRYGISPLLFDAKGDAGGLIENARSIENFPLLPAGSTGTSVAGLLRSRCRDLELEIIGTTIDLVSVEPDGRFSLVSTGGTVVETGIRALLLAAGTSPVTIDVDRIETLEGLRVFYEITDLKRKITPRRTAVIGSGDAAFDYALNLAGDSNAEVGIFMRKDKVNCIPALEAACRDHPRIDIAHDHLLSRFEEVDGALSLLFETPGGRRELQADALLVAIGRRSNLPGLLPEIDVDLVTPSGATNIPGLFAAGDIRRGHARQLAIAMGDGAAAAMEIVSYLRER